jgi:probable HAF family extracellular repeat protein
VADSFNFHEGKWQIQVRKRAVTMRSRRKWIIGGVLLVLVFGGGALVFLRKPRAPVLYKTTILPSLGGNYTTAYAINDHGQVAGVSRLADGDEHLFIWDRANGMRDLGPADFFPSAINNKGQILASLRDPDGHRRAFLWDPNKGRTTLPTLGGDTVEAGELNNLGQVVGNAETPSGVQHAFIWDAAHGICDLTPSDSHGTEARSLNDRGQVLLKTMKGAFLLNTKAGEIVVSEPLSLRRVFRINNSGSIVGLSEVAEGQNAVVVWHPDSGTKTVGQLRKSTPGIPKINDVGQVHFWQERRPASWLMGLGPFHARVNNYLWDAREGEINLNVCVSLERGDHFTLTDLNNEGRLVGVVHSLSGRSYGVLLEPILERWGE